MAIKVMNGPDFTLNTADTYVLGDGADGIVGTVVVHLTSSSFVGSISVKTRSATIPVADVTPAFLAVPYVAAHLNGAAGTYGSGITTAITGTSLIYIPAAGQSVALDCTSYTSGSMAVRVVRVVGAAA